VDNGDTDEEGQVAQGLWVVFVDGITWHSAFSVLPTNFREWCWKFVGHNPLVLVRELVGSLTEQFSLGQLLCNSSFLLL
jgi:hypothetical protein